MPTLPKKIFYVRLLFGLGAIVGGLGVMALQLFVIERVYILLSLGCGVAILGGLASPLFLKDWACAACGDSMDLDTIHVPPQAAAAFIPALGARNVGQMIGSLTGLPAQKEGNEVEVRTCGKCQRSVMLSAGPSKEVVFLDQEAQALTGPLKALVVPDDD